MHFNGLQFHQEHRDLLTVPEQALPRGPFQSEKEMVWKATEMKRAYSTVTHLIDWQARKERIRGISERSSMMAERRRRNAPG